MTLFRAQPVVIEARQIDELTTVDTPQGTLTGKPGDWLITDVKGNKHFCNADVFKVSYEAVETDNTNRFTRQELQIIRERSLGLSFPTGALIQTTWADAYKQLAFAADRLDAMIARNLEDKQ